MKKFTCDQCSSSYASSQSLWNHKQRCKSSKPKDSYHNSPQYIDLIPSADVVTKPSTPNPKITALADAILNDGIIDAKDEPVELRR